MFPTFISILDIQSWWEVPSISHFCSLFRTVFNLLDFDIEDLEEALLADGTEETSWLQELIVLLLKGCLPNNEISVFNYQMFLRRLFRKKCQEHDLTNPFNTDIDFQLLPLRAKVDILRALCDFRLEAEDVLEQLKNLEAESLRVEPLGYDCNKSAYWYFYGTRLYREDFPKSKEPIWQVICFTLNDWSQLVKKFQHSDSESEQHLFHTLNENFIPELPRLFKEKESLARKRLIERLPRRASKRLKNKVEEEESQKEEEKKRVTEEEYRREREEERRRREERIREIRKRTYEVRLRKREELSDGFDSEHSADGRYEMAGAKAKDKKSKTKQRKDENKDNGANNRTSNRNAGKGKQDVDAKPVGRQTNNSLASATGQILIQPVANPHRKKLKTSQVFSQSEEDLQTGLHKILDHVKNHDDAWPFIEPVEEEYAPNYYSIIRKPMDLQRMEERLESGHYKSFSKFKTDFQLIVNNCRLYNGADNEYTEMVDNLLETFDRAVERYLDQITSSDEEIAVEYQDPDKDKNKKKKELLPSKRKPTLAAQTDRKKERSPSVESLKKEESPVEDLEEEEEEEYVALKKKKDEVVKNNKKGVKVNKKEVKGKKRDLSEEKEKLREESEEKEVIKGKKTDKNKKVKEEEEKSRKVKKEDVKVKKEEKSKEIIKNRKEDLRSKNKDVEEKEMSRTKKAEEMRTKKLEEKKKEEKKKAEELKAKKLEEMKAKKLEEMKAKKLEEMKTKKLEEAKAKKAEEAKAKKAEEMKAKKLEETKTKKEEIKSRKTEEIKTKKSVKEAPANKKPMDSPKKNKKEPEKKPPIKKPEEKVKPKPAETKKPVVKEDKASAKKRRRSLSPARSRSPSGDRWSSSPPPSWPPSSPEVSSPKKKKYYTSEDEEIDNKGKHKQKNDKWKEIFKEEKSTEKKPLLETDTPPKHKDKHNKLRETIEKLKAKSDLTKLKEKDLKVYDFNADKTKENIKDVPPTKKPKKDTKITKKEDYEDGNSTADDSVQSDKRNKNKGTNSKTVATKNSTIEALTLATEQTLKDINKWLDDTPRISDYSSTSNSPSHFPAIEEIDGLNNKSEQDKKKSDKPAMPRKDGVKDVKKRPFQRDPAKVFRRKEVQRTIDRLQPGKSKGNLITNVQSAPKPDDLFPLGPLSKNKDTKNSLIVKTDDAAPKLSLGSVLDSFGEHKFVDDDGKEEKDEKEPKEDKKEQVEEKIVESKEEAKVEPPKLDNSPGKATPNLSAWFKAFGAPKVQPTTTKKTEKEDKPDIDNKKEDNNIKKVSVAEPSPNPDSPLMQPVPRQRKISTGSSMSERSSFSQDLDSPRVGIDERLGAYPAPYPSPLHKSPSGASPNIQSPRPDISPKYNFNGQMRVGFYQDTVSTKSSPDKSCSPRDNPQSPYSQYPDIYQNSQNYSYNSPYYSQPPNYSTSNPTPPYNNEQSNQGYYDTNKPLTDQYQAKNVNSPVSINQANSPAASQQSPINQSSQDSPIHQQPSPITQNPPSVESYQQPSPLDMLSMDNYRQNQQMSPQMENYRQNQGLSPKVDQYRQNQNDLSMDKYRQNITQDLGLQKELNQELTQQDSNRQNIGQQDLTRQNMSQQEQTRQNIPQQDLTRQNIPQQELTQHSLTQQDLRQNVQQQNLPQTDLTRQNMNQQQNLLQQDLSRQNLSQQNVSQQDLTRQNLSQQDLSRQNMPHQDLTRQNITDLTQNELPRQNSQEIPARQDIPRLDLTQQDLSQGLDHLPRQNLSQHQNLQTNIFGQENYQQQQQVDSYRQQEQFRQDAASGREKQGSGVAAATAAVTNFPVKKRAYSEIEQVGKFDERIIGQVGKFGDRLLSHSMDPVRLMRMQTDQNSREAPKYVHQNIPEPRSLNPQQSMLQTQQQTANQETNTLGLRNVNFPNATNPYNYNADSYPLNIPSATRTLETDRKDMSKFTNMGYSSPDMNFVRNQQQFNPKTSSSNEQNQLRFTENNVMNMGNYKAQQGSGSTTESSGRLAEVTVPRPTYSAPTSLEMDSSLIRGNLANLSHIVDRYQNDDRMLSGLQSSAPPPYYGDKNMPGQHMFPKPIATSSSGVPMFSQPNAMPYAHNIQSTNAMYNRPMAELQNSAAMLTQDRSGTLQQQMQEKKTKRRKTNKTATPPTSIIDTNPSSTSSQGFQSYTGLKNPASMEPSAISLKTASVVPGSAFNFGPTATGLGIPTGLYDKDAYPNYLEDFRAAPNYYMAAAAAAHHRSTPEGGEKPAVRAAHQSSNPQPTPAGYPFIGAPQPRPGYPPLGGHFMPPHQAGLMDTSSPLYQQYLQAGVLHHQGLLPPPGAYPPGYLSMRQPYDSMTRPFF